jgi:serine/threonine-protein phosphatase 2A regulatory subunit B
LLPNLIYLDKTVKLWKISEKTKRAEGYNLRDDNGTIHSANNITNLRIPVIRPMELMVEATPKRVFGNAHTYHINSISLNSDQETFLSADDLRINLWHTEVTDQSFSKYFLLLFIYKTEKLIGNIFYLIIHAYIYISFFL